MHGYESAAAALFEPYESISSEHLYAPVLDLFPVRPVRAVDIGAGTGRDAAWLAARGHRVVAVEPVAAFRAAATARHPDPAINWVDDRLPELRKLAGSCFELVLLSGVWQHLTEVERLAAAGTLARIAAPGALVIISIRHGPGATDRPVIDADPEHTITAARNGGLVLTRRVAAGSHGEANKLAGVHWTWLAFERR